MKKRLLALLLCCVLVLTLAGCAGGPGGETRFTLKVIHGDGTEFTTEVTTKKDTVGEALLEAGHIDGDQESYGLYVTTVDGETADASQEEWWCMTKDGGRVNTGVDSTPVEADVTYEFTLTKGF